MDLTESHTLSGHAQNAIKIFGRIDILVNNAGTVLIENECHYDMMLHRSEF